MKLLLLLLMFVSCGHKFQTLYTPNNIFHINEKTLEVTEENTDEVVFQPRNFEELRTFLEEVSELDLLIESRIPAESWVRYSWNNHWPKPVIIYNYKNMYNMPNYINWHTIGYISKNLKFKPCDSL